MREINEGGKEGKGKNEDGEIFKGEKMERRWEKEKEKRLERKDKWYRLKGRGNFRRKSEKRKKEGWK